MNFSVMLRRCGRARVSRTAAPGGSVVAVTSDELREWCLSMPGAIEDFPFAPGVSVFKVAGKMFALSSLAADPLTISVKCDPILAESLRNSYASIVPGYHLNKRHWLTVSLNEDAGDDMVRDLVQDSYDLVKPKRQRPRPAT
jgi:predicted DNA-binding protein (MmcQ/YjbR family)